MTAQTAFQFTDIAPGDITAASTLSSVMLQVVRAVGVALAAVLLNISLAFSGRVATSLIDLRIAFVAISGIGLISLFWYIPLEHGSGAELSGHKRTAPVEPQTIGPAVE